MGPVVLGCCESLSFRYMAGQRAHIAFLFRLREDVNYLFCL